MSRFYGSQCNSQNGSNTFVWVIDTSISGRTVSASFKVFAKGSYTPYYNWSHTVVAKVGSTTVLNNTGLYPNSDGSWATVSETINGVTYKRCYTICSGSYTAGNGAETVNVSLSYTVSGTAYYLPTTGTKTVSGSETLAANQWTVSYNANGGSSTPSSQTVTKGSAVTLASAISRSNASSTSSGTITISYNANGGTSTPSSGTGTYVNTTTTTYSFSKWAAGSTSGTQYSAGASYTPSANITMYAIWSSSSSTARTTNPSIKTAAAISRTSTTTTGYSVTYNANGGNNAPSSETSGSRAVTYTFNGWHAGSASGTTYSANTSYTWSANTTLYAGWNTSTSANSSWTCSSQKPVRPGYTFLGWSTSSTATSATYAAGSTYTITSGLTLYAVWSQKTYTITINPNGGTYNSTTSNTTKTGTWGTSLAMGTNPTRKGHTFQGWIPVRTDDNSYAMIYYLYNYSGTVLYASQAEAKSANTANKFSLLGQIDKIKGSLSNYGMWLEYDNISGKNVWTQTSNPGADSIAGYTASSISWTSNDWGGLAPSSSTTATFIDGSPNASTWHYAIGPYTAWSGGIPGPSAAELEGTYLWLKVNSDLFNITTPITGVVDSSNNYIIRNTLTLKANWKANTYTISYDANGGSGAPSSHSYVYADSGTTNLSSTVPVREGYTFLGWSTSSTATTASYTAGQSWNLNNAANYILYAVWQINKYYLDLNGVKNGVNVSNIAQCAHADVYINGELVAENVTDYYAQLDYATPYKIVLTTDWGVTYNGETGDALEGTIPARSVSVRPSYTIRDPKINANVDQTWKEGVVYINNTGTWQVAHSVWINNNGEWVRIEK